MVRELLVTTPDGAKNVARLDKDRLTVGRSSANDLCFPEDAGLSRHHLVFESEGDGWLVRDLGSKNGTLVNGNRILAPHRLQPGDRVSAGHLFLDFTAPGGQAPETVVFVEGAESEGIESTLVTSLEGLLKAEPAGPAKAPIGGPVQMQALIKAGRELAEHRPLDELFNVIMDLAIEAVGGTRGVLMTKEGDELVPRAARGDGFRISTAVRDRVLTRRESLLVRDAQFDDAFRERLSIVEQRVRSMMAVPLQTNDRAIGLIYLDSPNVIRPFTAEDLNLLTVMANVAAIRIENERLAEVEQAKRIMSKELDQAAEIQSRLLPSDAPKIPGLDLAGHNVACRTVGGDYYDFYTYPDGRVALLVGDVAGKGMPAALLMSSLQARCRVLAEDGMEPERLVRRLNRAICGNCPSNRFITFFLCLLDPATGLMTYCNAGHNPPLLIRYSGTVEKLEGGGVILGILPNADYRSYQTTVEPGDVVVLYSDGVTEAVQTGLDEEFGEERVAEAVWRIRTRPAAEIAKALLAELTEWTGGAPFADDVTLVIARRC